MNLMSCLKQCNEFSDVLTVKEIISILKINTRLSIEF